jgi:hypothetical protein
MASTESELVYVGFWQRVGACFLDGFLIYLISSASCWRHSA